MHSFGTLLREVEPYLQVAWRSIQAREGTSGGGGEAFART
jgi:hypothetical protein